MTYRMLGNILLGGGRDEGGAKMGQATAFFVSSTSENQQIVNTPA